MDKRSLLVFMNLNLKMRIRNESTMKKVSQGKNKQHRGYTIVSKQGKECR